MAVDPASGDEPADEEPDYRFTLANERTYLAWIRTALAFVAGAIAIVQFVPHFGFAGGSRVIGIALAAIGGVVAVLAWSRWRRVQLAMPITRLPPAKPKCGTNWTIAIAPATKASAVRIQAR